MIVVEGLVGLYLLMNLVVRTGALFCYPPYSVIMVIMMGVVAAVSGLVVVFPKLLRPYLLVFGFSFFLFGVGSIDIQSRVFEILVTIVALTLFLLNLKNRRNAGQEGQGYPINRPILMGLGCFSALAVGSLMLLPIRQIFMDMVFYGFPLNFFYFSIAPPNHIYYPVVAVLRLLLFVITAVLLARTMKAHENFKWLFMGMLCSGVFSAFIGLVEFYGLISLDSLRLGTKISSPGVLHALFVNRAWFGEFILVTIPFILIGFMCPKRTWRLTVVLFSTLILCEIALVMAGGRAGWVSYPVILFFCWLFVYFFKKGALTISKITVKDGVKVLLSVPITIVVSFALIYALLMPVSDYLMSRGNSKGHSAPAQSAESMDRLIKNQTNMLFNTTSRVRVWNQAVDVIREKMIFGMGYMSFAWHNHILSVIPESFYRQNMENKFLKCRDTPHNLYLQIMVGNGLAGLLIWLLVIGYIQYLLAVDLIANRHLLNIPVMISIISFHVYGIFQSMQTVPMIWLIIFLCFGYAMTLDHKLITRPVRRGVKLIQNLCVISAIIGIGVYGYAFESNDLAKKYHLTHYSLNQWKSAGFFPQPARWEYNEVGRWHDKRVREFNPNSWKKGEKYRWMGKQGRIYLPKDQEQVTISMLCLTPDAEKDPVFVTLTRGETLLDRIQFNGEKQTIQRTYDLPTSPPLTPIPTPIDINVSRTWTPHTHLNNFDRRRLGIGIKLGSDRVN